MYPRDRPKPSSMSHLAEVASFSKTYALFLLTGELMSEFPSEVLAPLINISMASLN